MRSSFEPVFSYEKPASEVGSVSSTARLENDVTCVKKVRQQIRSITSGCNIDDQYEPMPYERSTQQDDIQSWKTIKIVSKFDKKLFWSSKIDNILFFRVRFAKHASPHPISLWKYDPILRLMTKSKIIDRNSLSSISKKSHRNTAKSIQNLHNFAQKVRRSKRPASSSMEW